MYRASVRERERESERARARKSDNNAASAELLWFVRAVYALCTRA